MSGNDLVSYGIWMFQVSLAEVKLKVGEILAECGTQEAEKACKWFLLWHNR
jgi:hypothetical protein